MLATLRCSTGCGIAGPAAEVTERGVRAANEPAFRRRFEAFVQRDGPLGVSGVVIAEILIGVPDVRRHEAVVRALSAGSTPLVPEWDDWVRAAEAVSSLGGGAVTKTRSFWNDALLAAQGSRLRLTLVTWNLADFRRFGRYLPLTAVAPFPL